MNEYFISNSRILLPSSLPVSLLNVFFCYKNWKIGTNWCWKFKIFSHFFLFWYHPLTRTTIFEEQRCWKNLFPYFLVLFHVVITEIEKYSQFLVIIFLCRYVASKSIQIFRYWSSVSSSQLKLRETFLHCYERVKISEICNDFWKEHLKEMFWSFIILEAWKILNGLISKFSNNCTCCIYFDCNKKYWLSQLMSGFSLSLNVCTVTKPIWNCTNCKKNVFTLNTGFLNDISSILSE